MGPTEPRTSVIVGVDGSPSAVHAAEWAVDEAVSRDVPLRLVHVIQSTATDVRREAEHAEAILRAAGAAISQITRPVKVETAIVRGPVAETLVAESADAAMICIGAAGSQRQASKFVGATGTAVAGSASCPVAIISEPRGDPPKSASDDVAVVLDDAHDVDSLLQVALEQARRRHVALLVLNVTSSRIRDLAPEDVDRAVTDWLGRYSNVEAEVVMVSDDILGYLAAREHPVQLVVTADGDAAAQLLDPYGRFVLRDTGCSVLVIHPHG